MEEVPWKAEDMIQAEDIAELAYICMAIPKNIQIESMVIWPTVQTTT
jgi:NADP-dependent 3-hydroxy acid dehydrogenase YdfG